MVILGLFVGKSKHQMGQLIPIYFIGTVLISLFDFLIFSPPMFEESSISKQSWYYLIITLGNFGFAAMSFSHPSLLPQIVRNPQQRTHLISNVTTLTFGSILVIQYIASNVFKLVPRDQVLQFRILSVTCICLGLLCSSVFLWNVSEVKLTKRINSLPGDT